MMGREVVTKKNSVRKRRKKKLWKRVLLILLFFGVIAGVAGFLVYENSRVYRVCHVEAGVPIEISDFLKVPDEKAVYTDASDEIDVKIPGEYHLVIKTGFFEHPCTLYIKDTVAPVVEVSSVRLEKGQTCSASDFVTKIEDVTATTVTFVKEPDFSKLEKQPVQIQVTDGGNNVTVMDSELVISPVVKSLTVEAGSPAPTPEKFAYNNVGVTIVTDLNTIDFRKIGVYPITVNWNDTNYTVELKVVDTTPPVFEMRDITAYALLPRTVEEFVTSSSDVTNITFSFEKEPDFTLIGTQTVSIVAIDEGGNLSTQSSELTLLEDTEPPTIEGAVDMTIYKGDSVSYKANVQARDNCPEGLSFTVDSSQVNRNVPGTYPVTYWAKDPAGNSNSVTIQLTVRERTYDIEEVNMYADQVLAKIITDGMSKYDKVLAIYNYVKRNIGYINDSEKGDYVKAAYEGFVNRRGDCYVYASTAKVLLTRAGIKNMDIERIPSKTTEHYWNLVDIDDGHGWYHYDTTPRLDRPTIFLWNDAQMKEYSDRNYNSHNYDRSKYPVIP